MISIWGMGIDVVVRKEALLGVLLVYVGVLLFPVHQDAAAKILTSDRSKQGVTVEIDTNKNELDLYVNHLLNKKYKVALGKWSTPTPVGNWVVVEKQKNWGSGFGTRWIGLNVPWGIYGIHGTNKPTSIGLYMSNGCVRMYNRDVEELYERVRIGTPVIIIGNPLRNLRQLKEGNIGADVQLVQNRLNRLGFYRGPISGRFDLSTEISVKKFEKAHGLPIDGTVSAIVYRQLGLIKQ